MKKNIIVGFLLLSTHSAYGMDTPENLPQDPEIASASLASASAESMLVREANIEHPCSICLDVLGTNGGIEALACADVFCSACISRWRERDPRCPMCNMTLQQVLSSTNDEIPGNIIQELQEEVIAKDSLYPTVSSSTQEISVEVFPESNAETSITNTIAPEDTLQDTSYDRKRIRRLLALYDVAKIGLNYGLIEWLNFLQTSDLVDGDADMSKLDKSFGNLRTAAWTDIIFSLFQLGIKVIDKVDKKYFHQIPDRINIVTGFEGMVDFPISMLMWIRKMQSLSLLDDDGPRASFNDSSASRWAFAGTNILSFLSDPVPTGVFAGMGLFTSIGCCVCSGACIGLPVAYCLGLWSPDPDEQSDSDEQSDPEIV